MRNGGRSRNGIVAQLFTHGDDCGMGENTGDEMGCDRGCGSYPRREQCQPRIGSGGDKAGSLAIYHPAAGRRTSAAGVNDTVAARRSVTE